MENYSRNKSTAKQIVHQDCATDNSMLRQAHSSLTSSRIEWLDSETAANYLCVSVETLRNMTSNGQIPFYKLGKRLRFRRDELDSLLLKNKRGNHGN